MFVADTLAAWLIGLLADAGRKRLTTLVLGSEQERALRSAASKAVQLTADELRPDDDERADQLAMVINQVFGDAAPSEPLARHATVLEALQAGIAGQIAVLDDASLTGTGQSSADLLAVPGTVVAAKLTGHLLREIVARGSRSGPLTPLAGQLNHDLTHLQGQRIEGMLAQLMDEVRDALVPAGSAAGPVGWPLAEVRDPFVLEVHRPVEPDVPQPGLPVLPVYVPREHDAALAEIASEAAGVSGIAVLVGGSSTGKTRACWEALGSLRRAGGWRLWHPVDPQAALGQLPGAGPRTVVWLNEAQRYLRPADGAGERVAAGLRELLRDRARGPVLVLATLWPEYWDQLTARPSGGEDPHAQARELLSGHDIRVPAAFTPGQLRELEEAGDPRLAQAAGGSRDGQVVQYLAGAPELLDRYHHAPPAAQALIHAAMDAARLGMSPALPRAFLEAAAPGYLTDTDWDLLPGDWLEQALDYTAKPCKGVRGPLAPIRPRPVPDTPASPSGKPAWQLADYLDQQGRRARREEIPPASFWAAAASSAGPADLTALARAAQDRGLLRDAARLYKQANAHGHPGAGASLVRLLHNLHPGDPRPAEWAAAHTSLDDPYAAAWLLSALRKAGATSQVSTLLDRDPAAHTSLDNPAAVASLLVALREAGATSQVTMLASRAAAHTSLDDPGAVARLLVALREAGDTSQVSTLLDRDPAAHASLDDPGAVARLLVALREAGATSQVSALLDRDPAAHASLDDPADVAWLLGALQEAGATSQVSTLLDRDPAAHASLDDPADVALLLGALQEAGASGQVSPLANRAAHTGLDDPAAVAWLLGALWEAGDTSQVSTLLDRDPAAHTGLDDPAAVALLLGMLREAGDTSQVSTLLDRDPAAHTSLDNPDAVARLLGMLREAGATSQVSTLLDRDPAAHTSLDNPGAVARLLGALREAGATSQVSTLASRAAHTSLDNPADVAWLLDGLLKAGATGQVSTLLDRDPAAHTSLDNPYAVAKLLGTLLKAGATSQVSTLASRAAAHTSLDDPLGVSLLLDVLGEAGASGQITTLLDRDPTAHASLDNDGYVARLLGSLRKVGAQAQAAELAERLPAAGMFQLFRTQEDPEEFRFGRGADGRPARQWAWTDLP